MGRADIYNKTVDHYLAPIREYLHDGAWPFGHVHTRAIGQSCIDQACLVVETLVRELKDVVDRRLIAFDVAELGVGQI